MDVHQGYRVLTHSQLSLVEVLWATEFYDPPTRAIAHAALCQFLLVCFPSVKPQLTLWTSALRGSDGSFCLAMFPIIIPQVGEACIVDARVEPQLPKWLFVKMAVGQDQWYHCGVVAPSILVYFCGIGMFTGGTGFGQIGEPPMVLCFLVSL